MSKARGLADLGNVYDDGALSNRNLIINGNLAVNQRSLSIASVATGAYGEDRWKKTAGGMTQIIEEANYLPSTVYTLSGTNVTTQQITSPASGDWTLPDIPVTARLIQLELGDTATPFGHRSYGDELQRCQRYYQDVSYYRSYFYSPIASGGSINTVLFPVQMRATPTVATTQLASGNVLTFSFPATSRGSLSYYHRNSSIGYTDYQWSNTLDAEL